jgi:hypothetical protein
MRKHGKGQFWANNPSLRYFAKEPEFLRIHALTPSNRPVQATENLALFRREIYSKLEQQLQR